MNGSLVSTICGTFSDNYKDIADNEFKENGKIRMVMKGNLYYDGRSIYYWDFIYKKTGRVAWKVIA